MSPDEVCRQFAIEGVSITVRTLKDESMILIEGSERALQFLSELLQAQSGFADCGFGIGPGAAGSGLFSEESTVGLYIHRVPCGDHPK